MYCSVTVMVFSEIETPTGLWGQQGIIGAVPAAEYDANAIIAKIVEAAQRAGKRLDDQTLLTTHFSEKSEQTGKPHEMNI